MHNDYIQIELNHLKAPDTLSFTLYFFNSLNSQYTVAQSSNIPLSLEKLNELKSSNQTYYIHKGQLKTFLSHYQITANQIPSLENFKNHPRMVEFKLDQAKLLNYKYRNGDIIFSSEFRSAVYLDDFSKLIDLARLEIQCFDLTVSPTVSLANHLAKKNLFLDNSINRKVILTYFLAKHLGLTEVTTLANLVIASFLSNLGTTQIPLELARNPKNFPNNKAQNLYQKHPMLSVHLLKKLKINISEDALNLILDHHEFINGAGYPNQKQGDQLSLENRLLNTLEFIIDFHKSKSLNSGQTFHSSLINLKNSEQFENIRLQLDETIINALISFINTDNLANKKNYKHTA